MTTPDPAVVSVDLVAASVTYFSGTGAAAATITKAGGGGARGTGSGSKIRLFPKTPGQALNIGVAAGKNHFAVDIGEEGAAARVFYDVDEIEAGLQIDPEFVVTPEGNVQFRAAVSAPTTSGSEYPRSECRETTQGTTDNMAFNPHDGNIHRMSARLRATHLPANRPRMIVSQLHSGLSDAIAVMCEPVSSIPRLSLRVNGTGVGIPRLFENYVLGTWFDLTLEINGATTRVYLNGALHYSFPTADLPATLTYFFKIGAYVQSNMTFEVDPSEYGAMEVAPGTLNHFHTGWVTQHTKFGGGGPRATGDGHIPRTFTKAGGGAPRASGTAFKFVGAPLRKTGGAAPRSTGTASRTVTRAIRSVRTDLGLTSSVQAVKRVNIAVTTTMATTSLPFVEQFGRDDPPPGSEVLLAPYVPAPRRGLRVIAQRIVSGEFLDWDVPVKNLEIDYNLSGPKMIKGVIGPEDDYLRDINLDPWGTWLHVEENNEIRASGILLPVEIPGEFITIEAIGVSGYPRGMPWRGVLSEVQIDPLEVVRRIWAHLQAYPEGKLGVTVSATTSPARLGDPASTETTTGTDGATTEREIPAKPYELNWWEAPDCGSEIDSLARSTPFEWTERDAWNNAKTRVDHFIDLAYPRAGRKHLGPSAPRFVQNENMREAAVLSETPDLYASEVLVLGKGEGSAMIRGEVGLRNTGRLRRVAVVSDPAGISTSERAIAIGRDELARRAALLTIGDIVIEANNPLAPVGSFGVGDDILVEANVPYHGEVALWHRVIGYTWSPDTESMAVSLRRTEQFGAAGG